ncbi:MAG: transposase [Pyrinomonadaceae bacterium]|nr:transposase [Pyrinomonadaceae bacterium]
MTAFPAIMKNELPKGWYSRGYLPHYDPGSATQFITCRLFDSLPQKVLERFRMELETKQAEDIDREVMILIEKFLDSGYGECFLKERRIAEIVRDSLQKFDGERYKLISWIIMPNHIHLLLKPLNGWELSKILQSFKSFTAQEANKFLNRSGKFWMREYFDRYIRDYEHFEKVFRYIENNPVKAGFCENPEDWEFSSAYQGTPSS